MVTFDLKAEMFELMVVGLHSLSGQLHRGSYFFRYAFVDSSFMKVLTPPAGHTQDQCLTQSQCNLSSASDRLASLFFSSGSSH